jgi:hypothetical protein
LAIPVKVTEQGTFIAKLEHVLRAARINAKSHRYSVVGTYGMIGRCSILRFCRSGWFTYLKVPFDPPVELYQLNNKESSWLAEWSIR